MSREIMFRIWDDSNKEWFGKSDDDSLTFYGFHLAGEVMSVQCPPQWALDPWCIVEQYTGLKDKNGKEIYEGDVIKCWDDENGEVYFCDISLQYRVKFTNGDDEDLASCEAEVIGNIHESNMEESCPKE